MSSVTRVNALTSLLRAAVFGAFTLAMLAPADAANAAGGDLIVRYDQSQLIRLPRPATEVIVGNPSIADVNIQGGNLLVVTGKAFGITNIIALDAQRNVIQDQRILVESDDQRSLVLYRGCVAGIIRVHADLLAHDHDRRRSEVFRQDNWSRQGQVHRLFGCGHNRPRRAAGSRRVADLRSFAAIEFRTLHALAPVRLCTNSLMNHLPQPLNCTAGNT